MSGVIDLVTGVFEAGKTSFIKKLIENEAIVRYKNILIINTEFGIESYSDFSIEGINITIVDILKEEDFNQDRINMEIKDLDPDYVLIEYNGMWDLESILGMKFIGGYYIKNLINIVDYRTFDIYINNMEAIMVDKISNCDILVMTKSQAYDLADMNLKFKAIRHINKACDIHLDHELFKDEELDIINKSLSRSDKEIVKFGLAFVILNMLIIATRFLVPDFYNGKMQRILGIFLGLIVQILPFLLIGAILSSLIQVFVSRNRFNRIFEKTTIKSLIGALFAGIFFPVCDCAMVPVASSIIKKGYSYPVAITFLLASPAVNPIVILSTYYAFPTTPKLIFYRIGFGLLFALVVGLVLMVIERRKKIGIVKDEIDKYSIGDTSLYKMRSKGRMRYLEAIVVHTRKELFRVGFYLIIGAFISAVLQVVISKDIFISMNKVNAVAVIAMIIAAFFISVCSTSNAFIARAFYNVMPANAILAFIVMGPMLDITNLSVMLGTFKRRFMAYLILGLVYMAFVVFALLGGGFKLV
jgi:conserved domain protein